MTPQLWMMALPQPDREQFIHQCAEVLSTEASKDRFAAFANLLEDWRNTAELHSVPGLGSMLAAPIDEPLDMAVR